jgi:hypothetical protein
MKYICLETFDRHSKVFNKGDIYCIYDLTDYNKYISIYTENGDYITTLNSKVIKGYLIPLDDWREQVINYII